MYKRQDKENPFNICFEKWRKIVYSNHPYAFNTIGNANDVSKITHEDVLLEFKNLKNREKYLISNNLESHLKYWNDFDNFKEITEYIRGEKFTLIASPSKC